MYRSFTRSLLKPLNLQAAMYALISQLTLVCNMQLNVLDDLAEAMKALDGKKGQTLVWNRLAVFFDHLSTSFLRNLR